MCHVADDVVVVVVVVVVVAFAAVIVDFDDGDKDFVVVVVAVVGPIEDIVVVGFSEVLVISTDTGIDDGDINVILDDGNYV